MVNNLKDNGLLQFFTIDDTGIFAYLITEDFRGDKVLSELMVYIRKEYRGKISLVLQYIKKAESIARDNECSVIKIGGNIGYKDQKFLNLLKRLGYIDDTVAKYI